MGFVTKIISETDIIKFKIGNQRVHVDPDSVDFVDGDAGDIAPGQKLEAEGSLEGGILYAWEVEFWEPDQIEIEDIVTEFLSSSEFTVGDQDVETDGETVFENIDPDDIKKGLPLEIKGVPADPEFSVLEADKVSFEVD
jgi:hypothetical protein